MECAMQTRFAALLAVVLCFLASSAHAEKAPAAAHLLDVTLPEFGAIPNDGLDDYPAIKIAMGFRDGFDGNTLYFPCGTYNFHETVEWRDWPTIINPSVPISALLTQGTPPNQTSGYAWSIGMPWQGEDRDCVTIKLDDNSPGFDDPNAPKSFLMTGSLVGPQSNLKGLSGGIGGAGAYINWFEDLTVDCGSGNPGVRCMDWLASNAGELWRVKVKSGDGQGFAGIYMARTWPGPSIVMDTIIEGFRYCIYNGQNQYSNTFFRVTCTNPTVAGFYLNQNVATIEKFTFTADADIPAVIQSDGGSQLEILNSTFTTTAEDATHSTIETHASAKFFLENVETTGYPSVVKVGDVVREVGPNVEQAVSRVPFKVFNAPDKALDVPLVEPPAPYHSDPDLYPEEWANVLDYGVGPGFGGETVNDVAGIQAAFNSGKPIIFFPKVEARLGRPAGFDATYTFAGPTIFVPASVRRVLFYKNTSYMVASAYPTSEDCVFTVLGEASDPPVEFNYYRRGGQNIAPGRHICNRSNGRTVVVRNSPSAQYALADGPNTTFLIDTINRFDARNGAKVYAWQYNQEALASGNTVEEIAIGSFIDGTDTTVRIIGMKTEGDHTTARITGGAKYKMIGGYYFPCIGRNFPAKVLSNGFEIIDSQASLSFIQYCGKNPAYPGYVWENEVIQTLGSTTRFLRSDQTIFSLSCCSNRNYTPLFNGHPNNIVITPTLEDGPSSITVPYGSRFWSYKMVQVDPNDVVGVNMDPGMWTQPAQCQGASSVTMTVTKDAPGDVDFDLYSCQTVSGGPRVGDFDPSMPWTVSLPKNCRNLTSDVIVDGVGIGEGHISDFTYSEAVGQLLVRMVGCSGDCSGSVTLQCSRQ